MAKTKSKEENKAPANDTPKYGIKDLAKQMDLKEASVRVKLRNAGVAKTGKAYGWNTKSELEDVASQLAPAEKPVKEKKAPAKKAAAKKAPAKKAAKKKAA